MKKLLILTCIAVIILSCGSSTQNKTNPQLVTEPNLNPTVYAETITSDELKTMLYKYASDEFEGRNTGEKGQKMAVEYLKEKYQSMDISSPLGEDDYFQEVPLEKQKVANAQFNVNGKKFEIFKQFIVLAVNKTEQITLDEIAYVGYGIDGDNYSDYKNIDVKDKFVLAKTGEPKDEAGNFITSGTSEETKWSSGYKALSIKTETAKEHGARGILYMDNDLLTKYAPFYKRQLESDVSKQLIVKSKETELISLLINEDLAKTIHNSITDNSKSEKINSTINLEIENRTESINSENVLAYIKGSEKPNEVLVISAHLDHEGIKDGKIYNGADDDGSGTVAILEIAQAFKEAEKAGYGPKRTILFLHVTGEEKGLLGSKYYADTSPIFPLENTVANLNIDMIGRTDPKRTIGTRNYIYLIGSDKLSTELHNISEETNAKYTQLELDYKFNDDNDPNRFYYRSDHYNFAKNNIPVIFYFNGTHDDYHQPSDTPDKIEYDLLETRSRLVFYTAWELANRENRVIVDKTNK